VIDAAHGWTPSIARGILALTLAPADRDRMGELAARSRDGSLGADEQLEIESYRQACRLLDLMKAKARVALTADVDVDARGSGSTSPSPVASRSTPGRHIEGQRRRR
jgi:hypothetical protein